MTGMRAVWSGITWRRVGLVLVMGQIVALPWSVYDDYFYVAFGGVHLEFAVGGVYSLLLLPMALCADEAIRHGVRQGYVYAAVLLINSILACLVTGLVQNIYCSWYAVPPPWLRGAFIIEGMSFSVYGALGLLAFFYRRATERIVENLRGAELRRVELDRQLVESRLATTEAQVDPKMLLGALAQIKRSYESDAPEAEGRLDELIQMLRAAVSRAAATVKES